ncbi:transposase [Streptomyces sp. NBC_00989]|uniref:IS110 family transposase n=1 Tax=Streptomyces sp. NBC_00989 TaxID=2903705 RepID=UPI003870966C|nr:IS110 family transposase [Streptomyces sp. NBC_00989]
MTRQTHPRHDTADQQEQVLLGVDTHKDVHVAAVITSTGVLLDTRGFPTTREGYRQLLSWARAFGQLQQAGVECTGSCGAALTRYLLHEGITVTEVNQPDKAARRRHGKSDDIDAAAAARAVLSGRATATAKTTDGPVEAIRLFKMGAAPFEGQAQLGICRFGSTAGRGDPFGTSRSRPRAGSRSTAPRVPVTA